MELDLVQLHLLGILVFSSLFAGQILASLAREELKKGRNYIVLFHKIIFGVLLASFAYFSEKLVFRILAVLVLLYFLYEVRSHTLYDNNIYLIFTLIGFFLGIIEPSFTLIPAFLSFLAGLPLYSLRPYGKEVYLKVFIITIVFLNIGLALK